MGLQRLVGLDFQCPCGTATTASSNCRRPPRRCRGCNGRGNSRAAISRCLAVLGDGLVELAAARPGRFQGCYWASAIFGADFQGLAVMGDGCSISRRPASTLLRGCSGPRRSRGGAPGPCGNGGSHRRSGRGRSGRGRDACGPSSTRDSASSVRSIKRFDIGILMALPPTRHGQYSHEQQEPICPTALAQENCKAQREGVRSMFSGNDFRRISSVPAEKWTGPGNLQFSSVLPQPSNRLSSKAAPLPTAQ